jgi:hypothetical protein
VCTYTHTHTHTHIHTHTHTAALGSVCTLTPDAVEAPCVAVLRERDGEARETERERARERERDMTVSREGWGRMKIHHFTLTLQVRMTGLEIPKHHRPHTWFASSQLLDRTILNSLWEETQRAGAHCKDI